MKFTRAGFILNPENYQECVYFYGNILGLEFMFKIDRKGEKLTTFDLGGVYLMIETGALRRPVGNPWPHAQPSCGLTSLISKLPAQICGAKVFRPRSLTTDGTRQQNFLILTEIDALCDQKRGLDSKIWHFSDVHYLRGIYKI